MLVSHNNFQYQQFQSLLISTQLVLFTENLVPGDLLSTVTSAATSATAVGFPVYVWRGGLRPFHVDQHTLESSGHHISFFLPGTTEPLAYLTASPFGPTFKKQGYQALGTILTQTVTFTESIVGNDKYTLDVTLKPVENLVAGESWIEIPVPFQDNAVVSDVLGVHITVGFTESAVVQDTLNAGKEAAKSQNSVVQDTLSRIVTLSFTESLVGSDPFSVSTPGQSFDQYWTMDISVGQVESNFYPATPQVQVYESPQYGLELPILQNTLVAVTDATSVANPFQPTLVVRGTTIFAATGNPVPSDTSKTSVYFSYKNAGVTNLSLCQLYQFGFTLDYNGGNFNITSQKPVGGTYYQLIPLNQYNPGQVYPLPIIVDYGSNYPFTQFVYPTGYSIGQYSGANLPQQWVPENLGQNVYFFGLNGTIVESGRIKSNSALGYTAGGIFGNPLMNRQFALLAYNNKLFSGMFLGHAPTIVPPLPQNQMTCKVAAQAIIDTVSKYSVQQGLGEVHLQWAVQDAPYYDTVSMAGDNALQAIANIAQRCGGTLRWDGFNNYVVAYPDVAFGAWTVPDCSIIGAGGIEETWLLDLGLGRTGTGVLMVPTWAQKDNSQNNLPDASKNKGGIPTINQIAKITKVMTNNDPDLVYDLPQDFDQVYIQFLVPETGDTTGVAPIANESWVTNDPTQWFAFDTATLLGGLGSQTSFIFYTNIDGRLIPQVKVNSNVFPPSNSSINAGNFVLSLACSRKDLSGAFNQAQDDLNNMQRTLMEYNVRNYQFVKTYSGTINCMFFGSIPLPGMLGSATVGDMTVSGVIESVNFTYPGYVTVQVARYLRLDMMKPPLQWSPTGKPIGTMA